MIQTKPLLATTSVSVFSTGTRTIRFSMGRGQTAVNSQSNTKTMWRLTLGLAGLEGEQAAIVFGR